MRLDGDEHPICLFNILPTVLSVFISMFLLHLAAHFVAFRFMHPGWLSSDPFRPRLAEEFRPGLRCIFPAQF
jgi:hypothetical protein